MKLVLFLFVAICVFDPADKMLGGKVIVFGLIWLLTILRVANSEEGIRGERWLLEYVAIFVAIPTLSVLWYYISNGREPFDGLVYLKAYLLVSLALVLKFYRIDLVPMLSGVLVLLALAILAVFAGVLLSPGFYGVLKEPGIKSGLVYLDWRSYGRLTMLQAYFVTSPMLVIPISYYFHRMMTTKWKLTYLILTGLCMAGMIAAGTRNNIFVALLLPALLWPLYTRHPVLYFALSVGAVALLVLPFLDQLRMLLDPNETGNSLRIGLLDDYEWFFSQPATLIFGRGLGSYELWTSVPGAPLKSVSELTFFEVIRNFGIPAGTVMIGLLLAPVVSLWKGEIRDRGLVVAYLLYLVMSFSNPILFNSIGILVLSTVLARRVPPVRLEPEFRQIDRREQPAS